MAKLQADIENRVFRLPKPSSTAEALQPIFEAVSNAAHATTDRFGENASKKGRVQVHFEATKEPSEYRVIVSDNGIGLEPDRFVAFCTTDTKFKLKRGGKGVGRLLWLDAFELITVVSIYRHEDKLYRRKFDFALGDHDPIFNDEEGPLDGIADIGTTITMQGLRSNAYASKMPSRSSDIVKHFSSHFLADFLMGSSPKMDLAIGSDSFQFPEYIESMLKEERGSVSLETDAYGLLTIDGYILDKSASSDLEGEHQLHLVSSGRTVTSRKIDGLLGIGRLGTDRSAVFHGCVSGTFLDQRVNQERTQFNFSEKIATDLTKECVAGVKSDLLKAEISEFDAFRHGEMESFIAQHPSFGFEGTRTLMEKVPASASTEEAFAAALIKHKIRADKNRRATVQAVVDKLMDTEEIAPNLAEEISLAAQAALEDENRQLMEYVVRRKFIVEILDALLGRVRLLSGRYDTHLEETFHKLLCPMQIVGDDPHKAVPSGHDLWLLDERLAPAVYFASDAPMRDFVEDGDAKRLDLMVWDKIHGLGLGKDDKLDRVLLIEIKKPERNSYKGDYVLGRQMNRYMERLKNRKIRSHTGEIVELSSDVIFHCYVVADLVGDLKTDTQNWYDTPNGRGKYQYLGGDFRGTMEVIEWKELVRDAKVRNKNFLEAASLSFKSKGEPVFEDEKLKAAE